MNRLTTAVFVTSLLVGFQTAHGVDFHVAPDGDDAHPGTEGEPFATLERARDAVRKLKQAEPLAEPVTVFVRSGDYQLRPDSAVFQHLPGFLPIPFDKMGPSREQNADHHKGGSDELHKSA